MYKWHTDIKKYNEDYEPMSITLLVRVQNGENLLSELEPEHKGAYPLTWRVDGEKKSRQTCPGEVHFALRNELSIVTEGNVIHINSDSSHKGAIDYPWFLFGDRDFKKTPSVDKGNTFLPTERLDPCQEAQLGLVGQAAGAWRALWCKAQK